MSSRLFWNKANRLIIQNNVGSGYGIQDGIRSSIFALSIASVNLSFFSLYFDWWEYRSNNVPKNNDPLEMPNHTLMSQGMSHKRKGDGDEIDLISDVRRKDIDDLESEVENVFEESSGEINKKRKSGNKGRDMNQRNSDTNGMMPGIWDWNHVINNMYNPVRIFVQSNGLIWFVFGIPTAMVANKIMAIRALSGVMASVIPIVTKSSSTDNLDNVLS